MSIYLELIEISNNDLKCSLLLYHEGFRSQSLYYFQQSVEKLSKAYGLYFDLVKELELKNIGHRSEQILFNNIPKIGSLKYLPNQEKAKYKKLYSNLSKIKSKSNYEYLNQKDLNEVFDFYYDTKQKLIPYNIDIKKDGDKWKSYFKKTFPFENTFIEDFFYLMTLFENDVVNKRKVINLFDAFILMIYPATVTLLFGNIFNPLHDEFRYSRKYDEFNILTKNYIDFYNIQRKSMILLKRCFKLVNENKF